MSVIIRLALRFSLIIFLMVIVGCSSTKTDTKVAIDSNKPSTQQIEQESAMSEAASLQRQVSLFREALAPKFPKEAVETWARGVKARNGAIQFAVLSVELREKQQVKFEALNWVTGTSSPWVSQFTINNEEKHSEDEWKYEIQFELATSTGKAGTYQVEVVVKKYADNWYIAQINSTTDGIFPR